MLSLGSISFFVPWALAGLAVLPVVWWLVRFLPPSPRRVLFPPTRFLSNVEQEQPASRSVVWWILLLRIAAVVLLIVAAADPVYRPQAPLGASGPVVIVVEDGWASAANWSARREMASSLILRAEREDRPVVLLTTAPAPSGVTPEDVQLSSAASARQAIDALQPKPWPGDPASAIARLTDPVRGVKKAARVFWLSDGIELTPASGTPTSALLDRLVRLGPVTLVSPDDGSDAVLVKPRDSGSAALEVDLVRVLSDLEASYSAVAFDDEGRAVGRSLAVFGVGETSAVASFDVPLEIRNRVTRIVVEGSPTAGAVLLLDERWRRKTVGLVDEPGGGDQPLLSGQHYVAKALATVNDVRRGEIDDLLDADLPILVFNDPGSLAPEDAERLQQWTEGGGVLILFAGPRFADAMVTEGLDGGAGWSSLLPVRLRAGDRAIGGAMSWRRPATVAKFSSGPFVGLDVPGEIRVRHQVLAEPDIDIESKTWARLSDGTPLVTGAPEGRGWVALVHVTANVEWSNLPISGLFVEMLGRLTDLSRRGDTSSENIVLPPGSLLDGFGVLQTPQRHAAAIPGGLFDETRASPRHPPGYYGDGDNRRALNLAANLQDPIAITGVPAAVQQAGYVQHRERPLYPWLVGMVLLLLIADFLVSLRVRGHLAWRSMARTATVAVFLAIPSVSAAQEAGDLAGAIEAASETRIAYIETGSRDTDRITQIGLAGLARVLSQRTAVELAEAVSVDPDVDELAFYPIIYWPVTETSEVPSVIASRRVNTYLANGGMILFDAKSTDAAVSENVIRIAQALDVPRLQPVPPDHVLSRAFYLLNDYPGRWAGRPVWVAPSDSRVNDGVAPIIAGSHDWTAAWAMDEFQEPLFPVVPGGERQREFAFRFGVNLMMYALTGNYKADQVHIPSIMQRLGQ